MAKQADFPMNYGKVPKKQRCAEVIGTIMRHRNYGDVFIACSDAENTEKLFNRISGKDKCRPSLFQEMVVFPAASAVVGDKARKPLPDDAWEFMDTAPKDGREVILLVQQRAGISHRCLVGHYMPGGHCIDDHPPISAGWYFWNGCSFDHAAKPLLWMPLPETTPRLAQLIAKAEANAKAGN
ncbi:hypothetical protein [Rheinheimera sp.]|uniref:hypothetical protein n=1 Tax=Rheinheimera sp. TaxID=1869214 RepID=UPI002734A118|nr:hypothetical protein [Rheinheimera sp.]MDP2715504.1 hypothetical protein [Rheinheimera sp.]